MTAGIALALGVLGFVAIEAVLLSLWIPWFYRCGVGRLTVPVPCGVGFSTTELGDKFATGLFRPRLVFRRLSEHEIAFQEGASLNLWSPYVPVLKGMIEPLPGAGGVQVVGILLWYPAVALLAGVFGVWNEGVWAVLTVATAIGLLWSILIALQWTRFREVARALSDTPPNNELQRTRPGQATEPRR
jgi:hypothetical protein